MDFSDKQFSGEEVYLDENNFTNCEFHNCILIYGGGDSGSFDNCKFVNSQWGFSGAASNTFSFLAFLYQQVEAGGKESVEYIFESIRKGKDE